MSLQTPRARSVVKEELDDLHGLFNGFPSWMRDGVAGAPYRARLSQLHDELHAADLLESSPHAGRPLVDLKFERSDGRLSSLPAQTLGRLLDAWQALYDSLGQVAHGSKITRYGLVPSEVTNKTMLDVQAFAPGSFLVRMAVGAEPQLSLDPSDRPLGLKAFDLLEELIDVGDDEASLAIRLQRLKGRVASSYAKVLELTSSANVDFAMKAAMPEANAVRVARMASSAAEAVLRSVSRAVDAHHETIEFEGRLNAANRRTGSFEIDLGEEGTISGKVDRDLPVDLEGLTIGDSYFFTLEHVMMFTSYTSASEHYILRDVRIRQSTS